MSQADACKEGSIDGKVQLAESDDLESKKHNNAKSRKSPSASEFTNSWLLKLSHEFHLRLGGFD